jgi:hypothetical protein
MFEYVFRDTHRHPMDAFDFKCLMKKLADAQQRGMRVVRLFIAFYVDGYPILLKRKSTVTTVYISFGNGTFEELQKTDNIHCIGKFPAGVNTLECLKVWLGEIKVLEEGFEAVIGNERVFVCGGIGIVRADMPQGYYTKTHNFRSLHRFLMCILLA